MGKPKERRLFRFGLEWEDAMKLQAESDAAVANRHPHGVSTFSRSTRGDAVSAKRTDLERHFGVVKTGKNQFHHTVVLPKVITEDVAELFNQLFGRSR